MSAPKGSVEPEGPECLLQRVRGGVSVTGVAPFVSGNTHVRVGMSWVPDSMRRSPMGYVGNIF